MDGCNCKAIGYLTSIFLEMTRLNAKINRLKIDEADNQRDARTFRREKRELYLVHILAAGGRVRLTLQHYLKKLFQLIKN